MLRLGINTFRSFHLVRFNLQEKKRNVVNQSGESLSSYGKHLFAWVTFSATAKVCHKEWIIKKVLMDGCFVLDEHQ